MFEIEDAKLGRAKVVSITEARQSMATIMTDREFSYIITKNSEPVRVIVNYETLLKFQVNPETQTDPAPQPTQNNLLKQSKPARSLRGLLKEREEELRLSANKPEPQEVARKAVNSTYTPPSYIPTKIEQPRNLSTIPVPMAPVREEPQEYTKAPESADSDTSYDLTATQEFEGDFFVSDLPEPKLDNADPTDYSNNTDIQETAAEPEAKSQQADLIDNSAEEESQVSSEYKDYFKRFQKLYKPEPNEIPVALSDVEEAPANNKLSFQSSETGVDNSAQIIEEAPKKRNLGELPSIEDLLKELESTKLTGEE